MTKKYEFTFSVPTYYQYEIVANNERQAREMLEQGGIDINGEWIDCPDGEPLLEPEDYNNATLIDTEELE